jgi:uncharacterized membrane protein YeaQ/YmgE (transglycosylase-associated protein family)
MNLTLLVVQLISGTIGGNVAGATSKNGILMNTFIGAIAGIAGGQIVTSAFHLGDTFDIGSFALGLLAELSAAA